MGDNVLYMVGFPHNNPWHVFLRIFRWVRILCLLLIAGASVQLAVWNRTYDPRFYHFLSTRPGRALSRIMKWPNFYNLPPADKPEAEFTDEELVWKRRLEKRLRDSWPKHRLVHTSGEESLGELLYETEGSIVFRESFGGHGRLEKEIPRAAIARIERFTEPIPPVTWRDVRFQMEYPDFQLTWFGHYTVLTDAPYYQVASSVRELERMHAQYTSLFSALIRFPKADQRLQVLFFSREEQYRAHQRIFAPALSASSGYYSPLEDRMVVFNQIHSERSRQVREEINGEIDQLFAKARGSAERRRILRMRENIEEQLRDQGQRETLATLRHEAAHHLSYTYGVHSWIHAENAWLIEGLAVYFEPLEPGDIPFSHLGSLYRVVEEGRLPRLSQLINIRQPEQFEASLPGIAAYEAYALSWALVHFCMSPPQRPGFFQFLLQLQSTRNLRELAVTPQDVRLARALGMSIDEMEAAWLAHIRTF